MPANKTNGIVVTSGALIPESRDGQYESVRTRANRMISDLPYGKPIVFSWPKIEPHTHMGAPGQWVGTNDVDTFRVELEKGVYIPNCAPYLARWLQMLPSVVEYVAIFRENDNDGIRVWPVEYVKDPRKAFQESQRYAAPLIDTSTGLLWGAHKVGGWAGNWQASVQDYGSVGDLALGTAAQWSKAIRVDAGNLDDANGRAAILARRLVTSDDYDVTTLTEDTGKQSVQAFVDSRAGEVARAVVARKPR